jgi:phenylacetate-CoA ligase
MTAAYEHARNLASFIPPGFRQRPTYWHWRRFLARAVSWKRAETQQWQLRRLQEVVRFAYERTEGYREIFDRKGIKPSDIRTLSDVKQLPFTDKELLQSNLDAFSVRSFNRLKITSHGSTGTPFGFYVSKSQLAIEDAFMHEGWKRTGWKLGDRSIVLRESFTDRTQAPFRIDRYRRTLRISTAHVSRKTLPTYLAAIKQYGAKTLQAFPSALAFFCDVLSESGRVGEVDFDIIFLSSENNYPWQINKFKRVFPTARLLAWYGQSEMAILAPWCESLYAYHPWPFYGFTEIVKPDGSDAAEGEEGELVGTSWHNFRTPFIRYRTQDYAIVGATPCGRCGRDLVALDTITGRSYEVFVTSTGTLIPVTVINTIHSDVFDGITRFQFVQSEPGKAIIRYVSDVELPAERLRYLKHSIEERLGGEFVVSPKRVESIESAASGKYRVIEQAIDINAHRAGPVAL